MGATWSNVWSFQKGEKAVSYKSIFIFDDGSNWGGDWSHYDLINLSLIGRPGFGLYTRLDQPYQGAAPANRWLARYYEKDNQPTKAAVHEARARAATRLPGAPKVPR